MKLSSLLSARENRELNYQHMDADSSADSPAFPPSQSFTLLGHWRCFNSVSRYRFHDRPDIGLLFEIPFLHQICFGPYMPRVSPPIISKDFVENITWPLIIQMYQSWPALGVTLHYVYHETNWPCTYILLERYRYIHVRFLVMQFSRWYKHKVDIW